MIASTEPMEELYEVLHDLRDGAGTFASSGYLPELCFPGLFINNVGDISLPVQEEQAHRIIAVAKKAPFGLGEKTLIDESVRKSWELDPSGVKIKSERFNQGVRKAVAMAKEELGCNDKAVTASLYKVLLYEKGGFFKPHRDTEKEQGMFATMIIQLPSIFEGGKLIVRHRGKVKEVNFDSERSSYCCKYAAHYSDCEHEITEVKSGYRLVLIYSLCWNACGLPPSAAASSVVLESIARNLPSICTDERAKFAWFLEHKYSNAALNGNGIKALKGHDVAVANALQAANDLLPEEQKFDFHIAMVTRRLEQYGDCYGGRYGDWGEFEANGDENEEVRVENEWFKFDGAQQKVGRIAVDFEDEVVNYKCPSDMSSDDYKNDFWGDADEEENTGPTGNEGATQTYWYRNYAIFAWPEEKTFRILCENGYQAAVDWLANEFSELEELPSTHPAYQKAEANLKIVLNFGISNPISLNANVVSRMLGILTRLRAEAAKELVNLFLTNVMAKESTQYSWSSSTRRYCLEDDVVIPPLTDLVIAAGWESVSYSLLKMFQLSPVSQYRNWAELLKKLLEVTKNGKQVFAENKCFKSLLVSLVDAMQNSVIIKTLNSADAITWVSKTAVLVFLFDDVELLNRFTDDVLTYSNQSSNSPLLEKLVKVLENENLGNNPFWLKLIRSRICQLEKVEKMGVPPFSWNQSKAVIPGHPQVQAFLRGPQRSTTYQAFNGIKHARNWASKHFGSSSWYGSESTRSYSASVTTGGTGQRAHAKIEKTRVWYDTKVNEIQRQLNDLRKLRVMVNTITNTEEFPIQDFEPVPKKRAVATICID